MNKPIITIGFDEGECNFNVSFSITNLTVEQMNELRQMTFCAIGEAHRMFTEAFHRKTAQISTNDPNFKVG